MFTGKIRAASVAFAVAVAIGGSTTAVTQSADAAVKASPTGNSQLDNYCQAVAGLINTAIQEGNAASAAGDADGATQWYALAEYMARNSTDRGCHFTQARMQIRAARLAALSRAANAHLNTQVAPARGMHTQVSSQLHTQVSSQLAIK